MSEKSSVSLGVSRPYRQVRLQHADVEAVVNLPDDRRVRPGARLTLRGHEMGDALWTVVWVSEHVHDKSALRTRGAWWTIQ